MYLMLNIWRMTKLGDTNWKMGSMMKEYVFMGIPHLRFTWNLFLKLKKKKKKDWNSLPMDMHEASFNKLDYEDLCQTKLVSKDFKEIIGSDTYHASGKEARPSKALISSFFFLIKDGSWQCSRFDCISRKWRTLPPFTCLPSPQEDLFKEYFVSGSNELLGINDSKLPHEERLIVCNPATQENKGATFEGLPKLYCI